MNESEFQIEKLKALLEIYARLNQLMTAPGEKCHMLSNSIRFVELRLREILK